MLIRNAPWPADDEEVQEEIDKGLEKEIDAAINVSHPREFAWDSIFSDSQRHRHETNFHKDYPHCPDVYDEIHVSR